MDCSAFEYLLTCWKRADRVMRRLKDKDADYLAKIEALNSLQQLCINYALLSLNTPEMFANQKVQSNLVSHLVVSEDDEGGITLEFLNGLAQVAGEDEQVDFLETALMSLVEEWERVGFTGAFVKPMTGFLQISKAPLLLKLWTNSNFWLPEELSAKSIENNCIIGRLFSISPLSKESSTHYFQEMQRVGPGYASHQLGTSIQQEINGLHDRLFYICNSIVRSSPVSRSKLLDFFAQATNLNTKKRALQVDPEAVSSDGFMFNICSILSKFAQPFLDVQYSKIARAEVEYFRRHPRLDIAGETKLKADQETSEQYYSQGIDGENNFITEIFFLTVSAHYYGFGAIQHASDGFNKELDEVEKYLAKIKADEATWSNSPQVHLYRNAITRLQTQLDQLKASSFTYEYVVRNPRSLTEAQSFIEFVVTWMLRLVDPSHEYPKTQLHMPLSTEPTEPFNYLPEYFIEVITDTYQNIFNFRLRYQSNEIKISGDGIVTLALAFLGSPGYINNPHLKAKFAELLFYGTIKERNGQRGMLDDTLNEFSFSCQNLFPTLMSFYIEVEHTGLHTQFYDKFNTRYHISQVMKTVWYNEKHRMKLAEESVTNVDRFIQFIALLLNDATYLLDEALSKLGEIHQLQRTIEQEGSAGALTAEGRERQQTLDSAERQATTYMQLATESIKLLIRFTAGVPKAFMYAEVVDRLAGMLDFNLLALVGPKCTELKVRNPEKYKFDPRGLLSSIINVFLNLKTETAFIEAMARDTRSFKADFFRHAAGIIAKHSLLSSMDQEDFLKLIDKVVETREEEEKGELELGDVPDEFLGKSWASILSNKPDPLMFSIMTDPVILPTSKVTIDRSTIKSHLLSDRTDPFNRTPLKLEDVIPNTSLKEQIDAFRHKKKRKP